MTHLEYGLRVLGPGEAGVVQLDGVPAALVPAHRLGIQLLGVHEPVHPDQGDLALHHEHQQHGQHVQRDPQQVEQGQSHERCVGIQHVGRIAEGVENEE